MPDVAGPLGAGADGGGALGGTGAGAGVGGAGGGLTGVDGEKRSHPARAAQTSTTTGPIVCVRTNMRNYEHARRASVKPRRGRAQQDVGPVQLAWQAETQHEPAPGEHVRSQRSWQVMSHVEPAAHCSMQSS